MLRQRSVRPRGLSSLRKQSRDDAQRHPMHLTVTSCEGGGRMERLLRDERSGAKGCRGIQLPQGSGFLKFDVK